MLAACALFIRPDHGAHGLASPSLPLYFLGRLCIGPQLSRTDLLVEPPNVLAGRLSIHFSEQPPL